MRISLRGFEGDEFRRPTCVQAYTIMRTRERDEAGGAIHFAVALRPSHRTVPESGHLRERTRQ